MSLVLQVVRRFQPFTPQLISGQVGNPDAGWRERFNPFMVVGNILRLVLVGDVVVVLFTPGQFNLLTRSIYQASQTSRCAGESA